MSSILGNNIKNYRVKSNYTKTQLSKASGVALSTISQIESGARENLNADTVTKIATALGVTANDLMSVDEGIYETADLKEAIEYILSDDDVSIDDIPMNSKEKEQFKFAIEMAINTIRNNRK